MDSKALTRKEFLTLTVTLLGGAAAAGACSSSTTGGGSGGTNGAGTGGATGTGGGGGTGTTAAGCTDPLPETQVADSTGHVHTVTIPAADLDAAADQTVNTSVTFGHMHAVTLAAADLATLKAGGSVTVTSTQAGTPAHMHMYSISCK